VTKNNCWFYLKSWWCLLSRRNTCSVLSYDHSFWCFAIKGFLLIDTAGQVFFFWWTWCFQIQTLHMHQFSCLIMFVYQHEQQRAMQLLCAMQLQSCNKCYDSVRVISNTAPRLHSVTIPAPPLQHRSILLISAPISTWRFARQIRKLSPYDICSKDWLFHFVRSPVIYELRVTFLNRSSKPRICCLSIKRTFDFSAKRNQPETLSLNRPTATASVMTFLNSCVETH